MIYRIDPTDTPFMTGAAKEKASAVLHEWQTQALAAAASNAQLEGDDPTTNATTVTVRLTARCQISYKVARVSGTQQAVDHAGRDNELAYQEMLKGLELKRDMETVWSASTRPRDRRHHDRSPDGLDPVLDQDQHRQGRGRRRADPATAGTNSRADGTQIAFTEAR
jgi:hypothetical protein